MGKSANLEKYLATIKENRARLCSGEVTKATQRITIECSVGHKFETQPYRLTRKKVSWCPYCNQRRSVVDLEARERECSKCREWKSFDEFVLDPRKKLGITSSCKTCRNKHGEAFRKANPDKVKSWQKPNEESRRYYHEHKAQICARRKELRAAQNENIARRARWSRRTDPEFRALCQLRGILGGAIRQIRNGKQASTVHKIVGCASDILKGHFEKLFLSGMTWDNHGHGEGKWHVDHIRPCAAFDMTDYKQKLECFHYSNLRPLWGKDNVGQSHKAKLAAEERRLKKVE